MSRKQKPMTRSQNMAKIKSKNTKPEMYLRKLLYSLGIRYRVNYSELEGRPDIYISKYKTAIFVNGCFWHRHENCQLASKPKTIQSSGKISLKRILKEIEGIIQHFQNLE